MSTTIEGPQGEFEPDPEDWAGREPGDVSPEALENEPDDIVASFGGRGDPLPAEADEADVLEQRAEVPVEDDEDAPEA